MDPSGAAAAHAQMERNTHAIDVMASALCTQNEDETIEIRILRPHETYWRDPSACAPDAADRTADLDEA